MVDVEDRSFRIVAGVRNPQVMRSSRKVGCIEEHGLEVFICPVHIAWVGRRVAVEGDRILFQSPPIPAVDPEEEQESVSMLCTLSG